MKRTLMLSVFLFGWLLLFEACEPICNVPTSCYSLSGFEVIAYDFSNGNRLNSNDSVLGSNLVLDIVPEAKDAATICILDAFKSGSLMATTCGPTVRISPKIDEVIIRSSVDFSLSYKAGDDLSSLMGYYRGNSYGSKSSASLPYALKTILEYPLVQNEIIPYKLSERSRTSTNFIRFKENVEMATGQQVFTISITLDDNTILTSSSIAIDIQ